MMKISSSAALGRHKETMIRESKVENLHPGSYIQSSYHLSVKVAKRGATGFNPSTQEAEAGGLADSSRLTWATECLTEEGAREEGRKLERKHSR